MSNSDQMQKEIDQSKHFADLREAYRTVSDRTWLAEDFAEKNLDISRNLFTSESLQVREPRPKALEVYALLSGLPFAEDFTDQLVSVQRQISEILGDCLHYWVAPQNIGVEYCVFKWPTDPWRSEWSGVIQEVLASIRTQAFRFHIVGVQINPDGCVVAKGFDEDAMIFRIREQLKAKIPFLPAKQSSWAHVPLGRILEPVGVEQFSKLAHLISTMKEISVATTQINSMKLIHERRWYMEEKTILAEYPLANISHGGKS